MFQMPDSVVEWLAHSALGGGLLLLLGVILMGLTRRPARRQRLGEMALLSSLLVAGLCLFPAYVPWAIPLLPAPPAPSCEPDPPESPGALVGPALVMNHPSVPLEETVVEWMVVVPDSMEGFAQQRPGATRHVALDVPRANAGTAELARESAKQRDDCPAIVTDAPAFDWPALMPWMGAVYLAIVAALLIRCLIGQIGLYRLVRASVPVPTDVQNVLENLTRGWSRGPRLLVCPRLALPVSFGLWRPTILLPPAACRPAAGEELRLALVHELTHLERRDAWSCLLSSLGQAVYFYLPWLWWLRRQLRLCQEYIADAAAAALTRSEEYAQYLLSLAPRSLPRRQLAGAHAQGIWGNSSDLFRRITMLLDSKRRVEHGVPRWWSLAAGAGFLAAAVLVSGVSLQARADDKKDAAAEKKQKQDAAKEHLKEALKAYEALVGEKSELTKDQLRDALKLYEALIVDEKDTPDDVKKKAARFKDELKKAQKDAPDTGKIQQDLEEQIRRRQAEAQLKAAEARLKAAKAQADAQLKAAEAQLEVVRKQIEEQVKRAEQAEKDGKAKDPTKKDQVKEAWKHRFQNEFFENQVKLPDNVQLWFRNTQQNPTIFRQGGGRLGVRLEVPPEALIEQLSLAKEQGLLVQDVTAESAAAKAGVHKHDIVLFFGDQPVTHDTDKFVKAVREAKSGEPIEIVVLRKGKRATLKVTLADAKPETFKLNPQGKFDDLVVPFQGQNLPKNWNLPNVQGLPNAVFVDPNNLPNIQFRQPFVVGQQGGNVNSVITTVVRNDDRFTTRHQEGSLIITLTGTVEDGKAKVKEIVVQDGGAEKKYESVDKVPDQYKDKVKSLLEQSESGQVRVKVKSSRQ